MTRKYFRKRLRKFINVYLSKPIKSTSERWLLPSSCNYRNGTPVSPTASFSSASTASDDDVHYEVFPDLHPINGATLTDIDRYLHENFKSLYTSDTPAEVIKESQESSTNSLSGTTSSTTLSQPLPEALGDDGNGKAVMTVSVDPYEDFRKSMQEMVNAHNMDLFAAGSVDWRFLEDLLVCYLELNEKSVHESIFRAFKDLTKGLPCQNPVVRRRGMAKVRKDKNIE